MTTEQDQPAPQRQQEQGQSQPEGQAPMDQQDLNKLLQAQIAQAIQPVLADFRQQFAHSIRTQVETPPVADGNGKGVSQESQASPQSRPSEQRPGARQPAEQAAEPGDGEQSQEQPEERGIRERIVSGSIRPAFDAGLGLVERQGEQWLQSMILAGLEALLAETTHVAVQHHAEKGLHTVLQKVFDALPNADSATARELRDQTERTLQAILRESLDALFAEGPRGALLDHGKQASTDAARGHFKSALQHVQQALQALLQEIAEVLRRQWQRVLRLLLRLILTALQDSLAPEEGENLKGISAEPNKEKGT